MSGPRGSDAPLVAVTGATGFIGRHVCRRFARAGFRVHALARDPVRASFDEQAIRPHRLDLPGEIGRAALDGALALIHCAYATREADPAHARPVNELGTRALLEASREAGVPCFVFLSSQSAHEGATSYYGRSKLELERLLSPERDLILRPGLVLGRGSAGLFERMCAWVRGARVVPLFGGGRQPLQTVLIDDLVEAIHVAVIRGHTGRYTVAEPEPIEFARFLRLLAAHLGARPLFLPLPLRPTLVVLSALEALGLRLPVSSENLRGLAQMRADPTADDLARLGVSVRPAADSLEALWPLTSHPE
jgi:nucleoside-diphosphate-sugar epimerase